MRGPTYPLVLEYTLAGVADELVLTLVEEKDRSPEYGDEVGNAVDSPLNSVGGFGREAARWVQFDTLLLTDLGPVENARELGRFRRKVLGATGLRVETLHFEVLRGRIGTITSIGRGYRLTLRFIGPYNDFVDTDEAELTLVPLL